MYLFGGLGIATKGRKVSRKEAPILVVAPHSSFLDGIIIHVTKLSSPLVREEDMNLGSKFFHFLNNNKNFHYQKKNSIKNEMIGR
jgi:hypothetical protein